MSFQSNTDSSLIMLSICTPIPSVLVSSILLNIDIMEVIFLIIAIYLIVTLFLGMCMSTEYILTEDAVVVTGLWRRKRIPYDRIEQIECRHRCFSVEAPSSEQICLMRHGEIVVAVSPKEREEFLTLLRGYLDK